MSANGPPPSPAERTISARIATARRFLHVSQDALASAVGLTRDQLANIETGRTVLRFYVGWKICRELNINQLWLMTGEGCKQPFLKVDLEPIEGALDERFPFYEFCLFGLRAQLNEAARAVEVVRTAFKEVPELAEPMDELAIKSRQNRIARLRDEEWSLAREREKLEREIELAGGPNRGEEVQQPSAEKIVLTKAETLAKLPPVKSQLRRLLADLKQLTKESGKKTELAEFLGAPLASVSRWLSGEREPGGETTLRLLQWVEQAEAAQQEKRGTVATKPRPKTQSRSSKSNEKTKPSPK